MKETNSFKKGLIDGLPIGIGYLSVSFAFGIFSVGAGLSVLEAVMISLFNLTSAGQLAAVPIIAAGGSIIELIMTQLVINMRYALMSVSLSQKLSPSVTLADRFVISYANTDEIFAVSSAAPGRVGKRYMYGLMITPVIGWTLGTLLGAVAGDILPALLVSALGIAIYAMFIAIVVPAARDSRNTALCAIAAIALSALFYYTPYLSLIPSGFVITLIAVVTSALFALIAPIPDEPESASEMKGGESNA